MSRLTLLFSLLLTGAAVAHDGHAGFDPRHQHRRVGQTEVSLQVLSGNSRSQSELRVVLLQDNRWLATKIRLKILDAQGQALGASQGITPQVKSAPLGTFYVWQAPLEPGKIYWIMVQFQALEGLQRTGFEVRL